MNRIITNFRKDSPTLHNMLIIMAMLTSVCVVGFVVDDRTFAGINVWIKPFKFLISTIIYVFTVGFLIKLYPYSKRKTSLIKGFVGWTLMIEMIIVPLQASRGVASHYNQSSLFDGILFGMMGLLITINVIIMLIFLVDTARLKLKTTKSIQWAIFLGWAIVLFGSWVGGQMISQMSHSVGVVDGGEGLPLLNWSTRGGDLRIAHFFGLHSIQIIPIFALLLAKNLELSSRKQIFAVTLFAAAYASWMAFIFLQAKQGMPIVSL